MPIYEFKCSFCNTRIEELRRMGKCNPPTKCPRCKGHRTMSLVYSVPAVNVWNNEWQFPNLSTEGDGFATFETEHDYRAKLRECGVEETSLGVKEV